MHLAAPAAALHPAVRRSVPPTPIPSALATCQMGSHHCNAEAAFRTNQWVGISLRHSKAAGQSSEDWRTKKRAEVVYDYLKQKFRIDTTKIYVTWLGEGTNGACDLHFLTAKLQQRCVDLIHSTNHKSTENCIQHYAL